MLSQLAESNATGIVDVEAQLLIRDQQRQK